MSHFVGLTQVRPQMPFFIHRTIKETLLSLHQLHLSMVRQLLCLSTADGGNYSTCHQWGCPAQIMRHLILSPTPSFSFQLSLCKTNLRYQRNNRINERMTHEDITYLILGTADHEAAFPQPADRWFGVAKGRAGQSDATPFLGLYVLRWCICERRGSWGVKG